MGIKRIVDTSFWTDDFVEEKFTPEDKYFMLWLMTNPRTTQLGIYSISIKHAAIELGYSEDTINYLLERFDKNYGRIKWSKKTKEVAIKNYLRHSIIKGGAPVRDCLVKELRKVKNKDLVAWVFSNIKGTEGLNETVKNIIAEYEEKNGELHYCNEKDNENENENENEVSLDVSSTIRSIVAYLNLKAGTSYRATTKKTQECIKARLNEKWTEEDFKTVIDKKCAEWIGNEKMEKYLRPETLFGTKFEGYLNEKVTKKSKQPVFEETMDDLDELF